MLIAVLLVALALILLAGLLVAHPPAGVSRTAIFLVIVFAGGAVLCALLGIGPAALR